MDTIPANYRPSKPIPLQSYLFGHRVQPSQTKNEYLIEFLQVAISPKEMKSLGKFFPEDYFPIDQDIETHGLTYYPATRIGLKRFIFFPKSKLEGKANIDKHAYKACVDELLNNISGGNDSERKNSILLIQNLMRGFSAVNQNRSWFDQNLLPVCPEVILPEGMGVKSWREGLKIDSLQSTDSVADVDGKFDYHRYTYMCRGGEVYYLHLLDALNQFPQQKGFIEQQLKKMITSFPQFSFLSNFIQGTWDNFLSVPDSKKQTISKDLGVIPKDFCKRNELLVSELFNFFASKIHPFEKMEIFANGIILQLLSAMYTTVSTRQERTCWVIDINCKGFNNNRLRSVAIHSFRHNEDVISDYLYHGLEEYRDRLSETVESKIIKDAADDSYRLFRKMGKMIGIVIPASGPGIRFSLSEDIIKFLVLSLIPPKGMVTLDEFVDLLYRHFGMVIGQNQYREEMENGSVQRFSELTFMDENVKAFAQKLKDCGFLRDLSDATSIVENPYESEEE